MRQDAHEPLAAEAEIDWHRSLRDLRARHGDAAAAGLLDTLRATIGPAALTAIAGPYCNSVPVEDELPLPGDPGLQERLEALVRWNAMAMVVRANAELTGIGGHIATFASAATLYEVGQNHFWRGRTEDQLGDMVFFQGHAAPGMYARSYLEGRLDREQLYNFRRELRGNGGLSSYPHPWLMPEYWQFPTVSMGLGPLQAVYQARFNRYLVDRGLLAENDSTVWAMIGDGETDEPETTAALTLASREQLPNLIFVINCNLQRLDGPVRGNDKIIQELAARFAGSGWRVIKVVWGSGWDELLARDSSGLLAKRMNESIDGDWQKYSVESGAYLREHFFGRYDELRELVADYSDEQLSQLARGGHDRTKVYNAFKAAVDHDQGPVVILAKTIKGYGLGRFGEGLNITHNQKKLNHEGLKHFRSRFGIPLDDDEIADAPFYRPPEDASEMEYLAERRRALGGHLPNREPNPVALQAPPLKDLQEFLDGTGDRPASTTMAYVRILTTLLRDEHIGQHLVPIVPDEARTLGMDGLFRQIGIYSHVGQRYEPVDASKALYYREAKDGQVLEEGITEAGAMASFIAAGTAHAVWRVPMIPMYSFYSMFGFQRVGDLIYAAGDARARGFLFGATAGRTTLNGEGLQHQDGHGHLIATTVPPVVSYDPAYAYELAVIIQDGLRRMYAEDEDLIYYVTLYNEAYPQPAMPEGAAEGIRRGLHCVRAAEGEPAVHLWGSGPLLREALAAADTLAERYEINCDVWSCTSANQLYRDARACARQAVLHPQQEAPVPWLRQQIADAAPVVVTSDSIAGLHDRLAAFLPGPLHALGTDGFGRSESHEALRRHFEVDATAMVITALSALGRSEDAADAIAAAQIDPDRPDPLLS
ncbi:MAG: pyruvate dehydrogenase (acetyl-transferring), homodimeric type [Planctomycetota bacterium]